MSSAAGVAEGSFRIYEYPAGFGTTGEGETLADKRIEALELPRKLLKGRGVCRAFTAGFRFDFREHERNDVNTAYVLRRLFLTVDQNGYSNTFEAFPAGTPFRPPRTTRKPKITGTRTAIVTGPKGEEIWPDQYGRVKVQFHWDQEGKYDENTSCWIRTAQMSAGSGWGAVSIPRIGMEVIVGFLEGDPDRPIITGTVYNAEQTVPYPLPGDKTRTTIKSNSSLGGGGFNEMRFEDKKGQEEIYVHGRKDWNIMIENDKGQTIGHDETMHVKNNRTKTVDVDQKETIGKNKTINVGVDHEETVGNDMKLTVGADRTIAVGKNLTETVGKNAEQDVGGNSSLSVGKNRTETVGKASAESVALAKALNVGLGYSINVGGAMNTLVGLSNSEEVMIAKVIYAGQSITIRSGGAIRIEGKSVEIKGEDGVKIEGKVVDIN